MNIFVLDEDPVRAAQMQCNAHVTKMLIEQAQLLCFAHLVVNTDKRWLKRNITFKLNKSHAGHPCTLWLMDDPTHYAWGYRLLKALIAEYDYRYDGLRLGKYANIVKMVDALANIPGTNLTVPQVRRKPQEYVLAMGRAPECIGEYAVESYRRFYIANKNEFAKWTRREIPDWYVKGLKAYQRHGNIKRVEVI